MGKTTYKNIFTKTYIYIYEREREITGDRRRSRDVSLGLIMHEGAWRHCVAGVREPVSVRRLRVRVGAVRKPAVRDERVARAVPGGESAAVRCGEQRRVDEACVVGRQPVARWKPESHV